MELEFQVKKMNHKSMNDAAYSISDDMYFSFCTSIIFVEIYRLSSELKGHIFERYINGFLNK